MPDSLKKWRYHTNYMHAFKELPKRIYCEMEARNDEIILLDKINLLNLSNNQTALYFTDSIPFKYSLYTQAYCKFIEILMVYPELTQISSPDILKFIFLFNLNQINNYLKFNLN